MLNLPASAYAAPSPAELFVDPATADDKSARIEALVRRYFGSVRVRRLPVEITEDDGGQTVRISGVLSYKVRTLGERPAPIVADYLYPWLSDPVQGVVVDFTYNAPGQKAIRYAGTNAIRAQFRMLNPGGLTARPETPIQSSRRAPFEKDLIVSKNEVREMAWLRPRGVYYR